MALTATTLLNIRLGGSDTNGGGYDSSIAGGTDYSLQDAAQYALTNGSATTGSAVIGTTSASSDMPGNLVYVAGGTGSIAANWYRILSQVTGTSITLDRSTGIVTGTGVTLNIGGALATPGVLNAVAGAIGGVIVSGMVARWKYNATPYATTTATLGPGGPLLMPAVGLAIIGYDVTPGDNPTVNRPIFKWGAAAPGVLTQLLTMTSTVKHVIQNIKFDANSTALVGCVNLAGFRGYASNCVVVNATAATASGFNVAGHVAQCQADTCTTGFNGPVSATACEAKNCTANGFLNVSAAVRCLARACAVGFTTGVQTDECVADSCTTAGFSGVANFLNCVASNCTGTAKGFDMSATPNASAFFGCFGYNNNIHVNGTPLINQGFTALSADPWVSQSTGDFRPNNNNPGGAQLRGIAAGVFGQVDAQDAGAVQHADPAAGVNVFSGEF